VTRFFNYITGFSQPPHYQQLVTSPGGIRDFVIERIREEAKAGAAGRIIIKVNGLDDAAVIDALYEASAAGTPIDLVSRGICCLRPGVPGLSETIQVRSIVGRFLEHSRIFRFGGSCDRPAQFYIGSADLRRRNLDRRVEAMIPVEDPDAVGQLAEILDINLADDTQAWELQPDGKWIRVPRVKGIATQEVLAAQALERSVPPDDSRRPRSAAHKSVAGWSRRRRPT
jgi:polyphosphate kinase